MNCLSTTLELISLQKGTGSEQVRDACFLVHQPAERFEDAIVHTKNSGRLG